MREAAANVDFLIVGNGALGLFLADELARRNIGSIAIVGRADRMSGASRAAGLMLSCFGEVTTSTFASEPARQKFAIAHDARSRWPRLLDDLRTEQVARHPGEPLEETRGTHVVLNSAGGELDSDNFAAILGGLESYDEPWSKVLPEEIVGYQPRPDVRALRALYMPNEGSVNARQVLRLMEERVQRNGSYFVLEEAESLIAQRSSVVGVRLRDGRRIGAGTTVLSAGIGSFRLLRECFGDDIMPMFAGLGFAALARRTKSPGFETVVRTPNRSFACGLHLIPLGDGREYIGATNTVDSYLVAEPFVSDAHFLLQSAMFQLDERIYHHRIDDWLVGSRPVTLDGFPLVGWSALDGLFILTGTYRDGFFCSPVLAERVANELDHTGRDGVPPIFHPMRSPLHVRSVEQACEELVTHRMAAWFEARSIAPPSMSASDLAATFRTQAAHLYDQLDVEYGFGPDILMHLLYPSESARVDEIIRYLKTVERVSI